MVRNTKSASDTRTFVAEQAAGGFMDSVRFGFNQLSSASFLERARFLVPNGPVEDIDDGEIAMDEDCAAFLWIFANSLGSARLSRTLYLSSWPHRWACLLVGGRCDKEVMADWKCDWEVYDNLVAEDHKSPAQQALLDRHVFNLTTNKQWKFGTDEVGCDGARAHADLVTLASDQFCGVVTTTICEEEVGYSKNSNQPKSCSRFRRPEVTYNEILNSDLTSRYKFDFIEPDSAPTSRQEKLDDDAFRLPQSKWSLPFQEIQGYGEKAGFYSPSAPNATTSCADVDLLRHVAALGDLSLVKTAKCGAICNHKHMMAINYVSPGGEKQWIYPWRHFSDSSVLALPLAKVEIARPGQDPLVAFEPRLGQKPFFATILGFARKDEACSVVTHSWSWQRKHLPGIKREEAFDPDLSGGSRGVGSISGM